MSSKKSSKKRPPSNFLSFEDDGDGEAEEAEWKKVKKRGGEKHSLRKAKEKKEKKPLEPQSNTYLSSSGDYSRDALDELKKNAFSWGGAQGLQADEAKAIEAFEINVPKFAPDMHEMDIPNEELIRQARLKRDIARRKGESAINGGDPSPPPEPEPYPGSKNGPIQAGAGNQKPMTAVGDIVPSSNKAAIAQAIVNVAEDEDEEDEKAESDEDTTKMWMKQTMRKAGLKSNEHGLTMRSARMQAGKQIHDDTAHVPEELPSYEEFYNQLKATVRNLKNSSQQHGSSTRQQVKQDYNLAMNNVKEMGDKQIELGSRLQFFTEFKDYLEDLGDCYDTKEAVISKNIKSLEELHIDYYKDRMENAEKDIKDEMEEVLAAFGLKAEDTDEVDEFGRSMVRMKGLRERRRQNRKDKKKAQREANAKLASKPDGWSTDETDSEDEENYTSKIASKTNAISCVFKDVHEDFASLQGVQQRLLHFKSKYTTAYTDSYASMSLSLAFGPFVSIELAEWHPLKHFTPMSEMQWFRVLFDFGAGKDPGIENVELDLIPTLVKEKVIPIAVLYLSKAFDPLSETQTLNAKKLVLDLLNYCSPESAAMKQIFKAFYSTIKNTCVLFSVDQSRLHFSFEDQKPDSRSARAQAFLTMQRLYWSSVKLLHNIVRWDGILSPMLISKICIQDLLCTKIAPHLASLSIDSTQQFRKIMGLLEDCLDKIPEALVDGRNSKRALQQVQPVLTFIKDSLAKAYADLPEDEGLESDLLDLWHRLGGDRMTLKRVLKGKW